MDMIERKLLRRFFEGKYVTYKYKYVLYPKLDSLSRFRAPHSEGFLTLYLELPTL